jgi:hypothetical protein
MIKQINPIAIAIGIGVLLILGMAMLLVPLQYIKAQSGTLTYTDPSTGKSIQYPVTWKVQSGSNGGATFSDRNGLPTATFGVNGLSSALSNDLKGSVIAVIQSPTVHDLSVNIVNINRQPVAQFSYNMEISNPDFTSTSPSSEPAQQGPHLAHVSGTSVIHNAKLFTLQSFPGLSPDASYQQDIQMMTNSLLANNS